MIGDVRYTEPLKRQYNRRYYAFHIFKIVTNIGHSIKIEEVLEKIPVLGSIHQRKKLPKCANFLEGIEFDEYSKITIMQCIWRINFNKTVFP